MPEETEPSEIIAGAAERGDARGADEVYAAATELADRNIITLSPARGRLSRGHATALATAAAAVLILATVAGLQLSSHDNSEHLEVRGGPTTEPRRSDPAGRPDVTVDRAAPTAPSTTATTTTATTAPPATEPPDTVPEAPAPQAPPETLPAAQEEPSWEPPPRPPGPAPLVVPSSASPGTIIRLTLPVPDGPEGMYGNPVMLRSLEGGPVYYLSVYPYSPDAWCEYPCEDKLWTLEGYLEGSEITVLIPGVAPPGNYELCVGVIPESQALRPDGECAPIRIT